MIDHRPILTIGPTPPLGGAMHSHAIIDVSESDPVCTIALDDEREYDTSTMMMMSDDDHQAQRPRSGQSDTATLHLPWEHKLPFMHSFVRTCDSFVLVARHDGRTVHQLVLAVRPDVFRAQLSSPSASLRGEIDLVQFVSSTISHTVNTIRFLDDDVDDSDDDEQDELVAATIDDEENDGAHRTTTRREGTDEEVADDHDAARRPTPSTASPPRSPLYVHQACSVAKMRRIESGGGGLLRYDENLHVLDSEWWICTSPSRACLTRDPDARTVAVGTGGLLTDHAGTGKTVTVLHHALLGPPGNGAGATTTPERSDRARGTLVVLPLNLPEHWTRELRVFFPRARALTLIRGSDIERLRMADLLDADVVITTLHLLRGSKRYGAIVERAVADAAAIPARHCRSAAAMRAYARHPRLRELPAIVEAVRWHRLVIDEVHDAFASPALVRTLEAIDATHLWGITATPDCMGVDGAHFWKWMLARAGHERPSARLIHRMRARRTVRNSRPHATMTTAAGGRPAIERDLRLLTMDDAARDAIMSDADHRVELAIRRCAHTPVTDEVEAWSASSILQLHEREYEESAARDAALQRELAAASAAASTTDDGGGGESAALAQRAREAHAAMLLCRSRLAYARTQIDRLFGASETCSVCLSAACGVILTCGHLFCRGCIAAHIDRNGGWCPQCRERIAHVRGVVLDEQPWNRAASIAQLLEQLRDEPSVVFLQWKSLLRNVRAVLRGRGLLVFSLEGNAAQRRKTLSEHEARGGVLLISMDESFAGIHLPHASHVIFAHALVGDEREVRAMEYQAISRCLRHGQQRDVVVHSFVVRDFVEETVWNAMHEARDYDLRVAA